MRFNPLIIASLVLTKLTVEEFTIRAIKSFNPLIIASLVLTHHQHRIRRAGHFRFNPLIIASLVLTRIMARFLIVVTLSFNPLIIASLVLTVAILIRLIERREVSIR